MKRIAPAIFAVALLGALAFWWFSPAQVVKRRTENLLSTLTLPQGSGKSGRQLGVYSLNALLAAEVDLKSSSIAEANGTFERSDLESAFSWLCEHAVQTRFELVGFDSVSVTGSRAQVDCTINAIVELPADRPVDGTYRASLTWILEEDTWRLSVADWTGP